MQFGQEAGGAGFRRDWDIVAKDGGSGEQNNKQEGPPYSTEFLKVQRTLLPWD